MEKEVQPEQLQTERHPHQASVRKGRENVSAFPTLDPLRRHNTTTNSVAYVDCCHAMSLGCPISQIWTRHCQDNLSVAGVIVSSSATHTKKSQEQDRLARTRGEEEQGEVRKDEWDVRRRRKRWCVHAVKHPRERAIDTAWVDVGAGVGRIREGDACSHTLFRE
jgi:predicted alpha/beta hydrolase family esterase